MNDRQDESFFGRQTSRLDEKHDSDTVQICSEEASDELRHPNTRN